MSGIWDWRKICACIQTLWSILYLIYFVLYKLMRNIDQVWFRSPDSESAFAYLPQSLLLNWTFTTFLKKPLLSGVEVLWQGENCLAMTVGLEMLCLQLWWEIEWHFLRESWRILCLLIHLYLLYAHTHSCYRYSWLKEFELCVHLYGHNISKYCICCETWSFCAWKYFIS